jgi:hypothetical protein
MMSSILVPAWARLLALLVTQERTRFLESVPPATFADKLCELPMFVLRSRYPWYSRLRKKSLDLVRDSVDSLGVCRQAVREQHPELGGEVSHGRSGDHICGSLVEGLCRVGQDSSPVRNENLVSAERLKHVSDVDERRCHVGCVTHNKLPTSGVAGATLACLT